MSGMWLYAGFAKLPVRFVAKLLLVVVAGALLPTLVLAGFLAHLHPSDTGPIAIVALAAAVVFAALAAFVVAQLLRPIVLTARALREHVRTGVVPALPTACTDEAGTLMADTVRNLTQLKSAMDALAHYDTATGLPNREQLLRRVGACQRDGAPFALCVLTQHNHSRVVAAFGQQTADAVLRTLAQSLAAALGRDAIAAGIGGNQLAFVLTGDQPEPQTVLQALPPEVSAHGAVCLPDLALGTAQFPADGETPEQLLNAALAAVPPADAAERTAFYAAASRQAARDSLILERDLRRALEREEFCLYYQPVVSLPTGRTVTMEALIRWQHPVHGLIPPARFLSVLEHSGLAEAAGRWVLNAACRQLRAWSDAGMEEQRLAINLSLSQFRHARLAGSIEDALVAHGVAPSRLEIELTETMMMDDAARTGAQFARLREIGVTTAIDDFGTGFSSLVHLQRLPFDKIKIDPVFVTGLDRARDNQAICRAVIELGRGLGLMVVAEGVETEGEVIALRQLGCNLFQGYYFSEPLPPDEAAAWLRGPPPPVITEPVLRRTNLRAVP